MISGDILPVEIMARRDEWQQGVSLFARQVTVNERISVATSVEFIEIDTYATVNPFMKLGIQSAQQLMDELWQCGLRPTEGTGSAGSLKATEKHLDDMRKIAFSRLKIK